MSEAVKLGLGNLDRGNFLDPVLDQRRVAHQDAKKHLAVTPPGRARRWRRALARHTEGGECGVAGSASQAGGGKAAPRGRRTTQLKQALAEKSAVFVLHRAIGNEAGMRH